MTAVTDFAEITVPLVTVTGAQDATISINGLSALRVDNVEDNGPEILSTIISGVPSDTLFTAGTQTGFGVWVIPPEDLPTLQIIPPPYFAGTMNLELTAFTIESSTGEELNVTLPFVVEIDPVADPFLIVARNVELDPVPQDVGFSNLELRMDDDRSFIEPGEIPNEYVRFTYSGLPSGVRLLPQGGGRLIDNGGGTFTFTGTPDQASQLFLHSGPNTLANFNYMIDVSGVSIDGTDILSPPIVDDFRLSVLQDDTTSVSLSGSVDGGAGNDVLTGDGGNNVINGNDGQDLIIGGLGSDSMTGGAGIDVFEWSFTDIAVGVEDDIADFEPGTDILNLSPVFEFIGIDYNPQLFDINNFLALSLDGMGDATVSFAPALVPGLLPTTELVFLTGPFPGNTTIQSLFDSGSILL